MHSQQPPGVVQNWSTLQCSKQNTEQCGYDHAAVTRGRMRAQFPLPHGPKLSIGSTYLPHLNDPFLRELDNLWVQASPDEELVACHIDRTNAFWSLIFA